MRVCSEVIKGVYKYVPPDTDWYILDDNGLWEFMSKLDVFSFEVKMRHHLDAVKFVDHHKHLSLREIYKLIDYKFMNEYGLEYMQRYRKYY